MGTELKGVHMVETKSDIGLYRVFRGKVMEPETPFQDRVRKAADSAVLTLVARWAMVVTLPLGGFIGAALWTKLDKTSDSAARLEEKVTALIERQIPEFNLRIEGRFNAQSERLTDHSRRLERLEDWRNVMPRNSP